MTHVTKMRHWNASHQPMSVRTVKTDLGGLVMITYKIVNMRTKETVGASSTFEGAHAQAETLAQVYIGELKARIQNAKRLGLK